MDEKKLLSKSIKWVNKNWETYIFIENECVKLREEKFLPRVKNIVEKARSRGMSVPNDCTTFISRLVEHRAGIKVYRSRSMIDYLLNDDFWNNWDNK